jgi:DNA-binding NarL/FixJ family response regulator
VTESEPTRIVIVDDNAEFRGGLRGLLEAQDDLEVVGEATTGNEALQLAARLQPDIMLMDVQMPDLNGIEATRRLVATSPHVGVLVITMFDDDESVFASMRAGARGYLLKGARKAETLRAIRAVASGEAIFSPAIARRLTGYFSAVRPDVTLFPELTEREREVLTLLAEGRSTADIASALYISLKTVRNHISNILSKLQVADRTSVVLAARAAGLGRHGE